ncbi:MAG: periplasmic heavy metal sensor [Deltaproteobacteria bacterium]|nr:periplasmic heavy metal sensor [Deltaproteobacteria bacterium]
MPWKKKVLTSLGVLALTAALAAPAYAERQGRNARHGMDGRGGLARVLRVAVNHPEAAKAAGLTEADVQRAEEMMNRHQSEMAEWRAKLDKARLAQRQAVDASAFDENAYRKASAAFADVRAQMHKATAEHEIEVRKLLTKEQIDELRSQAREFRGTRLQKKNGPRGPASDRFEY